MGAPCDPDAAVDPCRGGFCLSIVDDADNTIAAFCSGRCTIGEMGCGVDPAAPGPLQASCFYSSTRPVAGDSGACGLLCDCDDDCRHPGVVCSPFDDADIEASTGRLGLCTVADDGAGGLEPGIPCAGGRPDASVPPIDSSVSPPDSGPGPSADAAPADATPSD
jgi:hypothetical protein